MVKDIISNSIFKWGSICRSRHTFNKINNNKMKKDIKFETLRAFATGNIKILADNQKAYNRHLETTENMILAFARAMKISVKDLASIIKDTKGNSKYNEELGKELGFIKEENAVSAPKKSNRKKS